MGHGRGKSASSGPPAPVAVADYNVTGEITPDAKCNYFYAGEYMGNPYYLREDGAWYFWMLSGVPPLYIINQNLGSLVGPLWDSNELLGPYEPDGGATGTAYVAAGPH